MKPEVARRIRREGFWMDMTEPHGGWNSAELAVIRSVARKIDRANVWRHLFG